MISLVPSERWGASSGSGFLPENGVWGHAPPGAFGRAAASPQTRQTRCWPSSERTTNPSSRRKRQDSRSLSLVLFPPKPLRWVSARALLWEVIKTPVLHFFGASMWGVSLPSGRCGCVGTTPRGVYFSRKNGFLRVGALRRRTRCSLLHTALFRRSCMGWYHYPRRALHAVETLDAQELRRRICRFYAAAVFALCGLNVPAARTHATPAPNRAHSGSHGETRGVLRVDGDDVFGSEIIDPIGPFQADQTVTVALAEGHRNTVSP